ncbi:DnaJ subfamily C member 17 [Achaetomium macrosporum]|uniref:DnaJ subfamily C member 17 n=1 Tax=Achaetomium macrosporum TaxID=79813 RepID=A0AAN7H9Q0_9PEZI|nr:DnaJ subfamily C member 17 [Achaetomium macrosporum]
MADQDLITYARDAASRGEDLFALLATDATASESEIRSAFRRKALTAHPDKTGDAFDQALYERLQRARDVLLNPAAREAYDNGMRAVLRKKLELERSSATRRRFLEDLERREEEAKRARQPPGPPAYDPEREARIARGRAIAAEMMRQREEAEVREEAARLERLAARKKKEADAANAANDAGAGGPAVASTSKPTTAGEPGNGQTTPAPTEDDLDEQIADLERQLEESRRKKAEKKQRRAERKAARKPKKKTEISSAPRSLGKWDSKNSPSPSPPPHPTGEPQADEDKAKPAEPTSSAPPPSVDGALKPSDRFTSMFARLRAAQAKKDEAKRKKAEEEARAAADMSAT